MLCPRCLSENCRRVRGKYNKNKMILLTDVYKCEVCGEYEIVKEVKRSTKE